MKKRLLTLTLLLASIYLLSAKDLEINVIDRDLELPLEGVQIREADSGSIVYTDMNGDTVITVPDSQNRAVLIVESIGYEPRKILVKDFKELLTVEMLMQGVLEGQELIVEEEAIGETDEEVGVSTVIEKEMIQSAAKIGAIEDVMTAIQILPGVIYSGGYGAGMSVRGGTVDGLTTVLDGFLVKYPYHWGGMYSIFNPNIIESVKFSPGIFSSKYGQATSALMEVNTVKPNDGFKLEAVLSTSTLEIFTQIPIGAEKKFGIFGGFRLTNYDFIMGLMTLIGEAADSQTLLDSITPITRAPYIYDFYLKALYRPSDRLEWYVNGFFGNDGMGMEVETDFLSDGISTGINMDYFNHDFFISTNTKFLAKDNLLIHFIAGYEYWIMKSDAAITESGTKSYSDDFVAEFGTLFTPVTGKPVMPDTFTVDTESSFVSDTVNSAVQGRLDFDWSVNDSIIFQTGIGSTLDITSLENNGEFWSVEMNGMIPTYTKKEYDIDVTETKTLNSFAYFNFDMNLASDLLSLNLGCRVDHSYFFGEDNFTMNTYPIPGPRMNLVYSPESRGLFFRENSFSLGAGLFAKTPFDSIVINEDFGIDDFELSSPKTVMAVLGWDTQLPGDLHFKIESYYKYIYDRFYQNSVVENGVMDLQFRDDGIGHVGGGDLLFERKSSRYIDGMLSYSFVYAKYYNPALEANEQANDIEPRGEWFYPSFHRFHSLNLLLDIKPTPRSTITTKLSFATGTPKSDWADEKDMYWAAVEDESGNIEMMEMYNRASVYSDTLRTNWVLDLDLKIAIHNYLTKSKVSWELYIAAENVLAPLMAEIQSSDSVDLDKWNGNEKETPSASLNFPIPSLGFKLSY